MEETNIDPNCTIMVGDTSFDIDMAKSAVVEYQQSGFCDSGLRSNFPSFDVSLRENEMEDFRQC